MQLLEISYLLMAQTNHKLSAMYLIDSIMKKVGKEYKRLLAGQIVAMFSTVFKNGDEGTRKKLYELRQTWSSILPPSRLYFLDVTIQEIDPEWPLTTLPKWAPQVQTIHFNPELKSKRKFQDYSSHSDNTEGARSINVDEAKSKKQKIDANDKSVLSIRESKSDKEETIPSTYAESEEEKIVSTKPPSLKRALEESYLNSNGINNKKVCLEKEVNPTAKEQTAIEDVDLRKLSMPQKMVPLSADSCNDSEDSEFRLYGKEDIAYRQLQFPPIEVQPRPSLPTPLIPPPFIFPVPHIATLPETISKFLPSIVPNTAMAILTSKSQHTDTVPSSSTITTVIPSFNNIHKLPSPSQKFVMHSQENSSMPKHTELIFDELSASIVSSPFIPSVCNGNASSLISSAIRVPPVTVINMVGEQSIDLTAVGHEIDSDIMCLDDTRNTYLHTCPVMTGSKDTYYGIMADIHDQLLWKTISRKEYNTLVVRLQEYSQRNQLDYFRPHYMSNMKGPPSSYVPKFNPNSSYQLSQNNCNEEAEKIWPTLQFNGQNASDSDYTFSQNVNYYPKETISQPTDVFLVNNTRPYNPFTSGSSQQVCKNAYISTQQYHLPANMVSQIRAPETSISTLKSILANVGQVNAGPPNPQRKARNPNPYVGGRNKKHLNTHRRSEPQMIPVENNKWLPQKDDMWNTEFLKRKNNFLIRAIYDGISCSSCALRFKPEEKEKYSRHLDWHFIMNKKQQESLRKANYTNWFVAPPQVMDFDEPSGSTFFDKMSSSDDVDDGSAEQEETPFVAISSDEAHLSICPQCHEKFKNFFHQELEEWHYANAIERNGLNYHPMCYVDLEKRQRLEREYNESSMSPEEISIDDSISESSEDSTLVGNSSLTLTPLQIINGILDDGRSTVSSISPRSNYIEQEAISIEDGINMFLPPPMRENQWSEVKDVRMNSTVDEDLSDIVYNNNPSPVVITRKTPLIRINIVYDNKPSPFVITRQTPHIRINILTIIILPLLS